MQSHMPSQSIDSLEAEVDRDHQAEAIAQDHIQDHNLKEPLIERHTTGHRRTDPNTTILDTDLQPSWSPTLDSTPIHHPIGASTATEVAGVQVAKPAFIAKVDAARARSLPHTATHITRQDPSA